MEANQVFAILRKNIKSALSGIARIEETPTGFKIITNDGNSFSYTIPNFHKHDNKTDILDKFSLDGDGKFIFKWSPIKLATFTLESAGERYVSDNFGSITKLDGTAVGTILPSGILTITDTTLKTATDIVATYRYDNEVVRDDGSQFAHDGVYGGAGYVNIPTADVEIGAIPVFADVYAMNATWSTMAEYDLMKETKMSMRDILQTQIVGELQREVDNRIITQLFDAADASAPILENKGNFKLNLFVGLQEQLDRIEQMLKEKNKQ